MSVRENIETEAFFKKLKKRNKEAFHLLYEEFKIPLYHLVFSMVRDNEKTSDILQDTFIKVIKKIHQLQDIKRVKHWIFKIAVNLTINLLNREKRYSLPGEELEVIVDKVTAEDFQWSGKDDREEVHYLILELVERLPVKQQVVFNLKYVEGFKEVEIGEVLDIPVGTVKSRLNIARRRIKEWLKHEMP
jgi:RNA polymerase sigma-70 factor, ECF subfamily